MKEGFQRRAKGSTFKLVASSCRRLAATARMKVMDRLGSSSCLSERVKMIGNGIGVVKDILVALLHSSVFIIRLLDLPQVLEQ